MTLVRTLISLLLVAVAVLSVFGIVWWSNPPEKLAGYETGGQVILAVLVACAAFGLWCLWAPERDAHAN